MTATSSTQASPLSEVKSRFGDKAKLVAEVQALATEALWLDRVNEDKGLARVSNAKLLRLHALLTRVQADFGDRAGLIGKILELQKRVADEGWKSRLERYPLPRLVDLHDASAKRAKREAAKPAVEKAPAKRVARTRKAKAKAAAAAA